MPISAGSPVAWAAARRGGLPSNSSRHSSGTVGRPSPVASHLDDNRQRLSPRPIHLGRSVTLRGFRTASLPTRMGDCGLARRRDPCQSRSKTRSQPCGPCGMRLKGKDLRREIGGADYRSRRPLRSSRIGESGMFRNPFHGKELASFRRCRGSVLFGDTATTSGRGPQPSSLARAQRDDVPGNSILKVRPKYGQ